MQKPNLPEPTAEQKAEFDKVRAQINELQPRYSEAAQKYFGDRRGDQLSGAEREAAQKNFTELSQQMQTLRAKLPREYERHGWVWLYLRKPAVR